MVTMELMPSPWDGLHKAVWGEVERTPAPKIEGKSDEGTA